MKSVVVEIKEKYVVALSDNGVFTKVKNKNYSLGEVLVMKNNTKKFSKKIAVSIASVVAIATIGTVSAFAYYTPVGKVSLDVNPSVEYSVNMFDKVLDVTGVNDDGEALLGDVDLTGKDIEDAISDTIDLLIDDGYITDEESNEIVIATYDNDENDNEELAQELEEVAQKQIEENDKIANVEGVAIGKERVEKARELGVTPGKLNLVEKLKESSDTPEDIDVEKWLDKPVKEIQQEIKDNKDNGNKPENPGNSNKSEENNDNNGNSNADKAENPGNSDKSNGNENSNKPIDKGNENSNKDDKTPVGEQAQEQIIQQTQQQVKTQEQIQEQEPIQSQEQDRENAPEDNEFEEGSNGNGNSNNNSSNGNKQSNGNKSTH